MSTQPLAPLDQRKLKSLIRLALFHNSSKSYKLKRQEINELIFNTADQTHQRHPVSDFNRYLASANLVLKEEFGLELVELTNANERSKDKNYLLRNTIPVNIRTRVKDLLPDPAMLGMIVMVLALIYVNGSAVADDELQLYLSKLNISTDNGSCSQNDPDTLPSYTELLTKLTKAGYVVRDRKPNDPQSVVNKWGPRAYAELSSANLRQAIAALYGYEQGSTEYKALYDQLEIASTL